MDELKFIAPNAQTKTRIIELWNKTVVHRMYTLAEETEQYLSCFPVLSAFNGLLVSDDSYYCSNSTYGFFSLGIAGFQVSATKSNEFSRKME